MAVFICPGVKYMVNLLVKVSVIYPPIIQLLTNLPRSATEFTEVEMV